MSRRTRTHRSSRQLLLVAVAFLLVMGLLSAGPAAAHTYTKADGNDSPGKLDIRSVSVSHTATGLVHTFRTDGPWTPSSLGADSFFIVQIDKNKDRVYERCAFIFYSNRLRGSLTNCRAVFIQFLPVAKLSASSAKITIPKSLIGNVYWWAGASRWDGPAPCGRGCIDFAPNDFPDILHDMVLPVANMTTTPPLRVWEDSTSPAFGLPFSVSDAHSGIKSWTVQRRPVDGATWSDVISGFTRGSKNPPIAGEGTRTNYRVVAIDKQGNQRISPSRRVYVPFDDDDPLVAAGFSVTPTLASEPTAFGESYSQMSSGTFTYTWTPGTDCLFELIGPGTGPWNVTVTPAGGTPMPIDDTMFTDAQRQTLFSNDDCSAPQYVVTVNSGTFGLDAVLG